MDKTVILAVAGSGKTTFILSQLDEEKRSLILTYTTNNIENLRLGIIKKFGYFPNNIKLLSYFSFIYSFCFKPYLATTIKSKGISWKQPPQYTFSLKRTNINYYRSGTDHLYHNRLGKLMEVANLHDKISLRLSKYYDNLFIDEIQDFAGNDFNFLQILLRAKVNHIYVGDFYQHTFDTSSDGTVNVGLHDNYDRYITKLKELGLATDTETLKRSYRCNATVCKFIRDYIGVDIYPSEDREGRVSELVDPNEIERVFFDNSIVKLFYKEHRKYNCFSENWGGCKGENKYVDVCVVLNKTSMKKYKEGSLQSLPSSSRNKLYVACSRTRNNLYLVSEEHLQQYKTVAN